MFVCGTGPADWPFIHGLGIAYPDVFYPSFGIHPYWVAEHTQDQCNGAMEHLINMASQGIAVAECGLDYRPQYVVEGSRVRQQRMFIEQLKLANDLDKVPVVHSVRAHHDVLKLPKEHLSSNIPFVVHGFSKGQDVAEAYLQAGGYISIGPRLLDPRAVPLRQAVSSLSLSRLLIESDDVGMNELLAAENGAFPRTSERVLQEICALKGADPAQCLKKMHDNICHIYQREWES